MTHIEDSGKRQDFSTGAVRDTEDGKPRLELISPFFLRELGLQMAEGAKKYNDRNWERGMPLSRYMGSALRHLNAELSGEYDENHMAAAAFNIMAYIHTLEMVRQNVLPAELCDMPNYDGTYGNPSLPPKETDDEQCDTTSGQPTPRGTTQARDDDQGWATSTGDCTAEAACGRGACPRCGGPPPQRSTPL